MLRKIKLRCNFNYFYPELSFRISFLFGMAGMGQDDTVNGTGEAKINRHDQVIQAGSGPKRAGPENQSNVRREIYQTSCEFPSCLTKNRYNVDLETPKISAARHLLPPAFFRALTTSMGWSFGSR